MKYLNVLLLVPLCWSAFSQAQTIEEIFPYTVQSHSDGNAKIHNGSSISGEGKKVNSGEVNFKKVDEGKKNDERCYGLPCTVPHSSEYSNSGKVDFELFKKHEKVVVIESGYIVENHKNFGEKGKVYIIEGDFEVRPNGKVGGVNNGVLMFVTGDADIKGEFNGYLYAGDDVLIQTKHAGFCGRVSSVDLELAANANVDSRNNCKFDFSWFDEGKKTESTLSSINSIGYVFGEDENAAKITITNSGTVKEQKFKVSYGAGALSYKKVGETGAYTSLSNDSDHTLPLNTPLYIKYNLATSLSLTLTPQIAGQTPPSQSVNLNFVPYMVEVQPVSGCPAVSSPFIYATHSSCPVLAKAGETSKVQPSFITYGFFNSVATKQASILSTYKFDREDLLTINEKARSSDGMSSFTQVGLITASVGRYCALGNGGCGDKLTNGSSAIIGRTVPYELQVVATSGEITGGIVYAGHPSITFNRQPSFTVQGLNKQGEVLSSYSGEFAGGLGKNSQIEIDTKLDNTNKLNSKLSRTPSESESKTEQGKHLFQPDTTGLTFIKDKPFVETSLVLKLKLTIPTHDSMPVAIGETTLAHENDKLRFGFLTLDGLELPVGQAGNMQTHLKYYADDINTEREDTDFPYALEAGTTSALDPSLSPLPQLTVSDTKVEVAAFDQSWKGTVKFEVPRWLQPKVGNSWIDPAILTITSDARKRGNDQIFNRREVVR